MGKRMGGAYERCRSLQEHTCQSLVILDSSQQLPAAERGQIYRNSPPRQNNIKKNNTTPGIFKKKQKTGGEMTKKIIMLPLHECLLCPQKRLFQPSPCKVRHFGNKNAVNCQRKNGTLTTKERNFWMLSPERCVTTIRAFHSMRTSAP